MSLPSEIAGRVLRLRRPQTRDLIVERNLRAEMDDGVVLLADRWAPRGVPADPPVVLVRTPYGRGGIFGLVYGRMLAERGFQAVIQSVRGTFGSGGEFHPFDERADGLATIRWLQAQEWCRGPIGMLGSSYMGLTQWAIAAEAGDALGALAPSITASQFHSQSYGGGSISLETAVSWAFIVAGQERRLALPRLALGLRRLPAALARLPLGELDAHLTGEQLPFFQEWFEHETPDDPYWSARDFSADVERVTVPVQLVGGWYDIFLPWLIADHQALRRAGRETQLIIGPWAHMSPALLGRSTREGIAWLRAQLLGDRRALHPSPVRVWVTGEEAWRDLEEWPPPEARPWELHLRADGALTEAAPDGDAPPSRFRYDPSDPTPSLGGPVLLDRRPVVDNRPLEARADVLTFTSAPLQAAVDALGPVRAHVWLRTEREHADVFVRVCDVEPSGASLNVCDALLRLLPGSPPAAADGAREVGFELWPTAHRFHAGHRVRVQVSGGAHPRYARNTGTDDPPATGTRLLATTEEVLHDAEHPSAVTLSVVDRPRG